MESRTTILTTFTKALSVHKKFPHARVGDHFKVHTDFIPHPGDFLVVGIETPVNDHGKRRWQYRTILANPNEGLFLGGPQFPTNDAPVPFENTDMVIEAFGGGQATAAEVTLSPGR